MATNSNTDRSKIKAVLKFPKPKNVKNVKSFLRLLGYYRKLIKSCSLITKPLINLLHTVVKFKWTDECQRVFDM